MEDLAKIGIVPNKFMPELPEVETIKNILLPILKNKKITSIDVLRLSTIQDDVDKFISTLTNQTFLNNTRIGKFLIFHLNNDAILISHLRMEGKYYQMKENEDNSKYARVVFHLNDGTKICYDDSRCFGLMKLSTEKEYKSVKDIAQLGKEPFDIDDVNYLIKRCQKSSLPIKSTLLDQTLITGLGNIYADEVLFASKINPFTPASKINKKEWEIIINNAKDILNEAIKEGGSTIKSYHPGKDIDGNFQTKLKAYGNKGKSCPNCSSIMRFKKVNGRGTTYCPKCQPLKSNQLKIAIYGKIASGKSTVLDIFKKNQYFTISSDDIVSSLYKRKEISEIINKKLGTHFNNEVNKNILREHLKNNPNDQKKLEKIIHPEVRKEILNIFKKEKSPLIVIEVPLLFEAKMDDLFDYIIAIDIEKNKQTKLLKSRNPNTYEQLLKINNNHQFDKNKIKADYIIENKSDLNYLRISIEKIINKLKDHLD